MAVSLKNPQDGGIDELSEINVTPFIDVMLVLLIIFMVAAPLSTVDIAVDLPVSNAQPQPRPDKPVFLTVKQDLTLALGNDEVPRNTLQATLDQQTSNDREQRVFLRADGTVADEGDEPVARGRLSQDRAGWAGGYRTGASRWRGRR